MFRRCAPEFVKSDQSENVTLFARQLIERLRLINTVIKPGFATARALSDAVVPVSVLGPRHTG